MLEAILGVVVVALLVERFLSERTHNAETARLTNAIIAKTAGELHMLDEFWAKDTAPIERPRPEPSPLPDGFEGQAGLS